MKNVRRSMMKVRSMLCVGMIAVSLWACNGVEEVVQETHADGTPKVVYTYEGDGQERKKVYESRYYDGGANEMMGAFDDAEKRQGEWVYYYKDGQLWSKGNFEHGLRSGKYTVWHANGQKRYEGDYQEDKPIGKWTFWKENGEEERTIDYDQQKN